MISAPRRAICLSVCLAVAIAALAARLLDAQVIVDGGVVVPTLKQQLETGLLARTPGERAFVDRVVELVNKGQLPYSLVQSTFLWARDKQPYPMTYFERALRRRARDRGISL